MAEQYFTARPQSEQYSKEISSRLAGSDYVFETGNGVFSKNRMDYGSKVLVETFIQHAQVMPAHQVLELGSGYGPIAIILGHLFPEAHITGVEVNERAWELAQRNAIKNQVRNIIWELADATTWQSEKRYQFVLTNPPIRAGKTVIQAFVQQAYRYLDVKGELWVVIQKKQGAPSMEKFMDATFGNVTLVDKDKGYWILKSVKTA
ncbi:methyltransferase [Aerococcaceae bacterium NML171108]|nr:methyltransferase [Aerococcaceae bacterium NML171108]